MPTGPMAADDTLVRMYGHEWLHNCKTFPALIRYNVAHLVMMQEQGVVPAPVVAVLVRCLSEMAKAGYGDLPYDPRRDGLQPNVEAEVTKRLGREVGGWLNTGRARQECELVARQIVCRDALVSLLTEATRVCAALVDLAERECGTVMPYYTWGQHAEPITFGYYAAAVARAVAADVARMRAAYDDLNRSRADIGQVVPPPLPLDRARVADLLGFAGIMGNSLYAYGSMDVELNVLSSCAVFMATLTRMAENLFVWAAPEFGFLAFGAPFTGTSYAMPQKRNPYALRLVRPVGARAVAAWNDAVQLFAGGLPMVGNGIIHVPNRLISVLGEVSDVCRVLAAALPTLELDRRRMTDAASDHWAQAAQLVYLLVRGHGISFRLAHEVVGAVVRKALEKGIHPLNLSPTLVESVAKDVTGTRIVVDEVALRQAMDPRDVVASRQCGGPAPDSVRAEVAELRKTAEAFRTGFEAERRRLAEAEQKLESAALALHSP